MNPTPVWADLNIIDIHGHLGSFLGYDLRTETLITNIDRFGLRLVLVSNIDGAHLPGKTLDLDEVTANRVTMETVKKYPDKLRGLVWTRPTDPEGSPLKVEPFLRDHGFVGVKLHPEMNQFPADSACVDGYLELCEKYRVPAVFHCGATGSESGPEKIYTAARRHPAVPVILYHMGFLGPHEDAIAVAKEASNRKDADLYLEISQAEPAAVLQAISALGAGRVLFGTDATYYGREHYEKYSVMVEQLQKNLKKEDFAKVMRENAIRLFRLK
jgi:predicted TIM-barrel fold metal-dependent hydrolase